MGVSTCIEIIEVGGRKMKSPLLKDVDITADPSAGQVTSCH